MIVAIYDRFLIGHRSNNYESSTGSDGWINSTSIRDVEGQYMPDDHMFSRQVYYKFSSGYGIWSYSCGTQRSARDRT